MTATQPNSQLNVWQSFRTLKDAPRELWLVYVMKCLESYAYFSMSLSMVVFLTDEFGWDDIAAGSAYGLWGFLTSVYGFPTGLIMDFLGVKMSLVLGAAVSAAGRLLFAFAWSPWALYTSLYLLIPLGMSLGIPVLTIGIKRYTTPVNRTFAYAFFYSVMNIAALISGPAVDGCRYAFGNGIELFGLHFSALRLVFLSGGLATCIMFLMALLCFREVHVKVDGAMQEFKPKRSNIWKEVRTTLTDSRFWRLMLFSLLIMAVRLLFRHLDATFPKYLIRELGKNAPYGSIYAINPFMIIFLVPIVGVRTAHIHPFKAIVDGSWVSAASPLFLVLGASYLTAILFVITLSLGEAYYSPRVYEFSMVLSPAGNEGLYSALSSLPLFGAKFFSGAISGALLTAFCPEVGDRRSWIMWLIIAAISLTSPLLMLILKPVLVPGGTNVPFKGDDDAGDIELNEAKVSMLAAGEDEMRIVESLIDESGEARRRNSRDTLISTESVL